MTTDNDDLLGSLKITFEEGAWRKDAACKTAPITFFFPERTLPIPKEARALCESCPVQKECLDYAIRMPITIGFWGGKNVRQRRILRREWLKENDLINKKNEAERNEEEN